MATNSNIQWTDHTINFWIGCVDKNEACRFCYAEQFANRYFGKDLWGKNSKRHITKNAWEDPYKYDRKAKELGIKYRVFCSSLSDFFEDNEQINEVRVQAWEVIRNTPNLIWLILTKRPENIAKFLPEDWGTGWDNVALGTSIGMNKHVPMANELIFIPAKYRFLSCEPLLDYPDLKTVLKTGKIDWVIVGGESGLKKYVRRFNIEWARNIKKLCKENKVSFFMKQLGARPVYPSDATSDLLPYTIEKNDRMGGNIEFFPEDLKVREFPFGI